MSIYRCSPAYAPLDATVRVPGSKSLTNRALVAAALADGHSLLTSLLLAEDTRLMIGALRALGIDAQVDEKDRNAEIRGCGGQLPASEADLFCGNAGTVMRFCAALVAVGHGLFTLDGTPRMRERPIGDLVEALRALGTGVEYLGEEGFPPLRVHARHLRGGEVAFQAIESSQFVSAILIGAPYAAQDVMIAVSGPIPSVPYLKMTTAVMDGFGVPVLADYFQGEARFVVPAPQRYAGTTFAIEPDASNASYFLAAPAVAGGRVTIEGLGSASVQGDVGFVDVLARMGCRIEKEPARLTVHGPTGGQKLRGIDIDLVEMPDTAQTLAVLALFAEGPTRIRNVANLRVKETDRLSALAAELGRLGARVEERPDGLTIHPPSRIEPAEVQTYNDHRMAMSFALAGLRCAGLGIADPECCGKTFPDFFTHWERMIAPASS